MKQKSLVLPTLFVLVSALFSISPVSAKEQSKFFCMKNEMKVWNYEKTKYSDFMRFLSQEFYPRYSTESRCDIVSGRLNVVVENAVPTNSEIRLGFKTGIVNRLKVICLAKSPSLICTKENLIITLSPKGNADPEAALERFVDTLKNRNSKKVFTESGGKRFFPLAPLLAE